MTAQDIETITAQAIEKVYRVRKVAEMFDVSTGAVYHLIASGELRAVRVGRNLRVAESAIAEFIATGGSPSDDDDTDDAA